MPDKSLHLSPSQEERDFDVSLVEQLNKTITRDHEGNLPPGISIEIMEGGVGDLSEFKLPEDIRDKPPLNASASRSKVRFLGLGYKNEEGNEMEDAIPVFVKTIPLVELDREIAAHKICLAAGIKHFPPLAVIRGEKEGHLITRKQEVTPLTGVEIDDLETFERIAEKVSIEAQKMGDWGLGHYDFKPKNIAIDAHEQVYLFDFQDSVVFKGGANIEAREHDLERFFFRNLLTSIRERNEQMKAEYGKPTWYEGNEVQVGRIVDRLVKKYTQKALSRS